MVRYDQNDLSTVEPQQMSLDIWASIDNECEKIRIEKFLLKELKVK
jgi:hypothetical protein